MSLPRVGGHGPGGLPPGMLSPSELHSRCREVSVADSGVREEGGFDRLLDVLGVTPIDETPLRMLVRTRRRLTWLQRPGWIFLFAFTPSRAWSERPLRGRFVSDLFRSAAKDR